ncbi:Pentatricopeptide repeat-containing protein [Zea mays]|uniref:Pentatricopeptide repeat-containing protein n=1 Tax=Zea mays TaxID=4577 RepID=A0A3L6FE54_MAIZE|nr:Pentatricopeptide repeat-containing protein [Zea mays]
MPHRDVILATAAIGALTRGGRHRDALALFSRVLADGVAPNEFTFGTVLRSATALRVRAPRVGVQLHACAAKLGLCSNVFVGSALVDHYAKMGAMTEAQRALDDTREPNVVSYTALIAGLLKNGMFDEADRLFRRMPERNVVSWNAMIGGCSQAGLGEEAVNLFLEMCRGGVSPNESTFPCVLTSVASAGALGVGRSIHASAIKFLGKLDVYIGNSLVSFYARCGSLEDSVLAFKKINRKNVVSWNALICGYAQNGKGEEALDAYRMMRATGLKPDNVTLLGLLFGCNHTGLVDEGYALFKTAEREQPGILKPEHYACVVDLLSRAKRFDEARRFLEELPFEPGIGFWKALLGGCQIHWNSKLAESVAKRIRALDPKDTSSYILLSNVYSASGSWQSVSMVRREIKEKGLKRITGCSWIEVQEKVHVFFNGDCRHHQSDEIYSMLESCFYSMEDEGEHSIV